MSKTFTQFREEILPENIDLFSILSDQSLVDVLLDETNEDVVSLLALQELFEREIVELDEEDYETLDESLQHLSEFSIPSLGSLGDRALGYAVKKGPELLTKFRSAFKPPAKLPSTATSSGKDLMIRPGTSVAKPSAAAKASPGKQVALKPSTAVSKSAKTPITAPKAGGPSRLAKGATIAGATLLGGSAMRGGTGAKPKSYVGGKSSSGSVSGGSGSKSAGGGKMSSVKHSASAAQTSVKKSLPTRKPEADPNAPGGPGGRVTAVAYGSKKAGITSAKNVYQNAKGKPTELAPKPRRDTATGGKWM